MPITFQVTSTKAETVKVPPHEVLKLAYCHPSKRVDPHTKYDLIRSSFGVLEDNFCPSYHQAKNSFVMSGVKAYLGHHNWIIKPDDVWLAICIQFSHYVNGKSEELRDRFVDFKGKKQLTVYGDGTLFTANYEKLASDMTVEIAKNIKDPLVRDWIVPDFTTSTSVDKMVGAAVLMSTTKKYFDYKFMLLCNLPSVTLLGQVEDWVSIRERANKLLEFDLNDHLMEQWTKYLFPVLDKFVDSIKGNPDTEWWNRIAHFEGGGSGPKSVSGWITSFCLFSEKGAWQGYSKKVDEVGCEWPTIQDSQVPEGIVTIPIIVDDNGVEYNTEMIAGHLSSNILGDNKDTIQPKLDWALFIKTENVG